MSLNLFSVTWYWGTRESITAKLLILTTKLLKVTKLLSLSKVGVLRLHFTLHFTSFTLNQGNECSFVFPAVMNIT